MTFRFAAAAFLVAMSVASLATAAETEALTGAQITATVAGNTIEGTMVETGRYTEFYDADGTIKGADYVGAWSVEGDTMCFQYGEEAPDCWSVGKAGDEVVWIKDGETLGTGRVVSGNPNGF